MKPLALVALLALACRNPAAPAPSVHTDCIYTDTIAGVGVLVGYFHGERCHELMREYPTRTRWVA